MHNRALLQPGQSLHFGLKTPQEEGMLADILAEDPHGQVGSAPVIPALEDLGHAVTSE